MADGLCKTAHLDESDNNKKFQDDISSLNNNLTAYILKNYLEILPKFTMLNQRNLELYESSKCCRCNVTIETWIHEATNDNVFKNAIQDFVVNIRNYARIYIWNERCKDVINWEKKKGHSFCLEFVQSYSGQFQNIFWTHCFRRDVEMSTDHLKLLQQVTDKSNFKFYSNNQTLEEVNMRLHNPVPKDLQVYKPHLQKSLVQLTYHGIRPEINEQEAPKCYINLMNKCWNSNPDNKPNVIELKESFNLFRDSTDNYHMEMRLRDDDEIEKQFKEAEEIENKSIIY
ncbi:hypothetical protein RhiirA5_431511 [Rhizophagus irregularis]|uniref:Serine-threonine/tyrosine-protein kinase catalytic domain-containing protein n=1 Tax=Rhizophagus irregularis TaxID=588596 RepID=A0A2N0NUT9_9GLOM|nr:hypothetical protein RhiirA5_431511 [Rhizophagus irregularis]